MINGVQLKKLKVFTDERGLLMEMIRNDDHIFDQFGQVYLTMVRRGVAKGWHYHKLQDDHFVCVAGKALVVLYDQRDSSPTKGEVQEFILAAPGRDDGEQLVVKIPKGVVHGFAAIDCDEARIINVPTMVYNYEKPDELRYEWNSPEIPYKWPEEVTRGG
ncbi:MAG: dTDP-4-dehydrorhamnose 3,5-epimerase family protein [Patescibacteria group bacterium]